MDRLQRVIGPSVTVICDKPTISNVMYHGGSLKTISRACIVHAALKYNAIINQDVRHDIRPLGSLKIKRPISGPINGMTICLC